MTRARRGLSPALFLVCLCLALPAGAAADDPTADPYFGDQWGLQDINAPAAWQLSTGAGVKVAVVDTGVWAGQEDLAGRVLGGWGFDGSTDDSNDHGTRVAGVIAAVKGNGKGIAGVAPDASIVPIRAFDAASTADGATILEAVDRAARSGARVVNLSFGTKPLSGDEAKTARRRWRTALAAHPETLYVAAAGNESNDNDVSPEYPCSVDSPNLICVGAYGQSGARSADSNYGAGTVDLFAPGEQIYTTSKLGYWADSGTSMAAPFVSGEAALLFAEVPQLTPGDAIHLILGTARTVDAFAAQSASGGRPDALAALRAATADGDRDGVYDIFDRCPAQPSSSADGCAVQLPTPTPSPSPTPLPTPVPPVEPARDPQRPRLQRDPPLQLAAAVGDRVPEGEDAESAGLAQRTLKTRVTVLPAPAADDGTAITR